MRELVPNHVRRASKAGKDNVIAIAEHHLLAIPECVVIIFAEMDRRHQWQAGIVNRVAMVNVEIEVEGVAQSVISLVHRDVSDGRVAFRADEFAGKMLSVSSVKNGPLWVRS